jgi:hypothetical protein
VKYVICYVSCTSPLIIVGPILGTHVFVIICTLGWDDGISPILKVEGMAYDCYAKCGKMPSCFGTPTSPISCSTFINVPDPIIAKDVLVML